MCLFNETFVILSSVFILFVLRILSFGCPLMKKSSMFPPWSNYRLSIATVFFV
jgi:hypothetical protein